ncbi:MAG: SDR family oxidoreductase [Candidatus Hydrogenedentota bacterium]
MRIKEVLVTGGAGFIGSHLVERLVRDGHHVTVLDNFCNGRRENLRAVIDSSAFAMHEIDVAGGPDKISEYFRGVDWVFHLAGLADIVPSIEKPLDYHHANVNGTISVLEASRQAGVKRFVYAASSSCYGIPDRVPTPETAEIRPMYPYALTKYLGEEYVLRWSRYYGMGCVSLRLFNVFGPRSRTTGTYGAVFGVFLAQKLAGKPFTVVGDGKQTRDFTYVTDVADAFVRAAESDLTGDIFNVGSSHPCSINDLTGQLGGEIVYIARRPGEPDCTWADISKIARALEWKPKVNFQDGVRIMLEHIEDWRKAPVWDEASISQATESWFRHLSPHAQPARTAIES